MGDTTNTRPPTDKVLPKDREKGAPEYSDDQYQSWLEDMRPFLRQGCSLNYAIEKAGLEKFKGTIYNKSKQKDWFFEKITRLQSTISDLNNSVIFKIVERVHTKLVESKDVGIDPQEAKIIALVAEKHRTSQPYWVTKVETSEAKEEDFGKIVEPVTINYVMPSTETTPNDQPANESKPKTDQPAGDPIQTNAETTPSVAEANGSNN